MLRYHLDYSSYWEERYSAGFNSGDGSYGDLAIFKAETINKFIQKNSVRTIIEFGCGDGNQLKLMEYKKYLGFDITNSAIKKCQEMYVNDPSKSFLLYHPKFFTNKKFLLADLVLCLDVLYHIIPEEDYVKTLDDIFSCSARYVILYTDIDEYKQKPYRTGSHVCHRDTLEYLKKYSQFKIMEIIQNKYPDRSWASFIILECIP